MSRKRSSERDARLRELLQKGDPAAGEPGLSAEEVHAMRRTVLTAVPERGRFALIPTLATGAAVALAVLLAIVLWRGGEPQGIRPSEVKVAVRPAPPVRPAAPPATPEPPVAPEARTPKEPEPVQEPVRKRQAAPRVAPPPPPVLPEPEPLTELASVSEPSQPEPALEEPRGRHVEFSTPGGTRVIWVLTEDETLLD
jgi:hypothetical protein